MGWAETPCSGASGRALRAKRLPTNISFSESGSTSGPSAVMLALSALPAVSITSRPIFVPGLPSSSSRWITQLQRPPRHALLEGVNVLTSMVNFCICIAAWHAQISCNLMRSACDVANMRPCTVWPRQRHSNWCMGAPCGIQHLAASPLEAPWENLIVRADRAAEGIVVGAEARAHEAFQALLGSLGLCKPYTAHQGCLTLLPKQAAHL